jgi:ribosome recycling factor
MNDMNQDQLITDTKNKLATTLDRLRNDLKTLRTGRASAAMLDGIMVEAYGTTIPINQVATIIAPEAQMIQITPFDPSTLAAISTSIRNNPSLGLNPSDDGRVVRVPIPALTEERRREIAKQIGEKVEDCFVRMRAIRHDALGVVDKAKKDKQLGEDDAKRLEKQVDEIMNTQRRAVEAASKEKEQEILSL